MTIVSIDVETDGPIPFKNSMLSLGAAAYDETEMELGSFYIKFRELTDARPNTKTLLWWGQQNRIVWEELHTEQVNAAEGIPQFIAWLRTLPQPVKMMASPAGFDFTFVRCYCVAFGGTDEGEKTPYFNCIDLRTLAMPLRNFEYGGNLKKDLKALGIKPQAAHTHNALDDAREQAEYYFDVVKLLKGGVA